MKTVLFTPADSVEMYSGKLVIVGVFDTIKTEKFPIQLRPFDMAIKVLAEKGNYGKTYAAKVVFKKVGTRKPLIEFPVKLGFVKRQRSRLAACAIVVKFPTIKFETDGIYVFELRVGTKLLYDTKVNVIKLQQKKTKKN